MRVVLGIISSLQLIVRATSYATDDIEPFPPLRTLGADDLNDVKRSFLSSTLGSNMVLQRDRPSTIWGFTVPGAIVNATLEGTTMPTVMISAVAGADGTWRARLPSRPASLRPTSIRVSSSTGETAEMTNVLFGDVYMCGGQSNMQFAMSAVSNATAEIALADKYPHVRLFTVGDDTASDVALDDLQTVLQPWEVANSTTISRYGGFGVFSAVCWFFGRTIADGLGNRVPIGLVSNDWGGTNVEAWSTRDVLDECPGHGTGRTKDGQGVLYNAMVHPYTVGPMAISGFAWYQGEANTADQHSADVYSCLFPALIRSWRKVMEVPDAYFGFVQLSTWCPSSEPESVPEMRDAQMAALNLPGGKVGYATNADRGAGCNIHPPAKQACGIRLGNSALALNYGRGDIHWRSPSYAKASPAAIVPTTDDGSPPSTIEVAIRVADVGAAGLSLRDPYNRETVNCNAVPPGTCAWASLRLSTDGWVNATATIRGGRLFLVAEAAIETKTVAETWADQRILGTLYGWGPVPMMSVYDAETGLPLLPWKRGMEGTSGRGQELRQKGSAATKKHPEVASRGVESFNSSADIL